MAQCRDHGHRQTNKQTNLQTDAPSLNSYLDNRALCRIVEIECTISKQCALAPKLTAKGVKRGSKSCKPTPIFFDMEISSDLHRSHGVFDRRLGGGGKLPRLPPVATPLTPICVMSNVENIAGDRFPSPAVPPRDAGTGRGGASPTQLVPLTWKLWGASPTQLW